MRNLLNPKWLLLTNTLPAGLLALLCYGEFSVIRSLLPPESLQQWRGFGLGLAGLTLGTLIYGLWFSRRRQTIGVGYSMVALAAYSAFLCLAASYGNHLVPWDVPRWMVPMDLLNCAATFLMPTLVHALFVVVLRATPPDRPHHAGINFLLTFSTPPVSALAVGILASIWETFTPWGNEFWLQVGLVVSTIGFLFFLVRAVYILGLRRAENGVEFNQLWKGLIGIVLPLLGLLVNSGFSSGWGATESGVFGNFSNPWFYALALLNGVLLCLPDSSNRRVRLLVFLGRSILFGYTFYFFLVFLPYLPLSILAVLLLGLGLLMLAPLMLLVVHVRELSADYRALQAFFSEHLLQTGLIVGVLTLPLGLTANYLYNRQVLHQALAYVYSPDYSKDEPLNASALAGTLAVVRQHKENSRDFMSGRQVPYLSMYFNWLVLDNLTLSEAKIATLEQVFLGALPPQPSRTPDFDGPPTTAQLRRLSSTSTYDARQQAWVSWVHLDVANADTTQRAAEYATALQLPVGCWVGDYYLNIGARRERGILAEKKAAAWVYAQIVNENRNRDPGLLAYTDPNRVALKVYPVVGREVRRTGLQLLPKEPFVLTVDGRQVVLGDTTRAFSKAVAAPGNAVVYVSAQAKKRLPLVRRQPVYHFLLDVSAGKSRQKAAYQQRIAQRFGATASQARFSLVNTYTTPLPAGTDWVKQVQEAPNTGGFYLDRAIRKVLFDAQQHPAATYPVLVVVTDNLAAVLPADFAAMHSAYPESELFYVLTPDGQLMAHSLRHAPAQPLPGTPNLDSVRQVRAWPNAVHPRAYLPDNELADIVLNEPQQGQPLQKVLGSRWQTGLLLKGQEQWQTFHPEVTDAERVPFIRASFSAGIMTPFTSYLALENDAQKAALRRKQKQVLDGNAALDVDESAPTAVPLDGGAAMLLALGLLLGVWWLKPFRLRTQA